MPNGGGDVQELWQYVLSMERRLADVNLRHASELSDVRSDLSSIKESVRILLERNSQFPSWIWAGIMLAVTIFLWLADKLFGVL